MLTGITNYFNGGVKIRRLLFGEQKTLTAHAGGGQANALQILGTYAVATIVATGNDSLKMPPEQDGRLVIVTNQAAANALQLFSFEATGVDFLSSTGTSVAGATGISLIAGKSMLFVGAGGNWNQCTFE